MRFGPKDMTPPARQAIEKPAVASKPLMVQLQFNQSGAWRGSVIFEMRDTPVELLMAADTLARLSRSTARLVACAPGDNGRDVPTRMVVGSWSRAKGWA
jgi:hypothetical protein